MHRGSNRVGVERIGANIEIEQQLVPWAPSARLKVRTTAIRMLTRRGRQGRMGRRRRRGRRGVTGVLLTAHVALRGDEDELKRRTLYMLLLCNYCLYAPAF